MLEKPVEFCSQIRNMIELSIAEHTLCGILRSLYALLHPELERKTAFFCV